MNCQSFSWCCCADRNCFVVFVVHLYIYYGHRYITCLFMLSGCVLAWRFSLSFLMTSEVLKLWTPPLLPVLSSGQPDGLFPWGDMERSDLLCHMHFTPRSKVHWQDGLLPLSTFGCIGIPIMELGKPCFVSSILFRMGFGPFFPHLFSWASAKYVVVLKVADSCKYLWITDVWGSSEPFSFLLFKWGWEWHTCTVHSQTPFRRAVVCRVKNLDLKIYSV